MTYRWMAVLLTVAAVQIAAADQVQLVATKDNTLYEHTSGRLGNGAGSFLFSGTTGQARGNVRRLLLAFDLSEVPVNAAVTHAELSLTMSKTPAGQPHDFRLHRVLADWSEGTTDAAIVNVEEGQGDIAADGDATWIHRSKPDTTWQTPGGDFVEAASATLSIGGEGEHVWGADAELVADVEFWLNEPSQNFGWVLIGNESMPRTASRFNSRTNADEPSRPLLTVDYELQVPNPADCNGDGILDVRDAACACLRPDLSLNDVLEAANLVAGDIDGNGNVGFEDFLLLSARFGQQGEYVDGDLNCDGDVNFGDFLILSANFGASSEALAAVPEPHTWVLLSVVCGSATIFRRFFSKVTFEDDRAVVKFKGSGRDKDGPLLHKTQQGGCNVGEPL